jgi:hypothetical protein
VPPSPSMVTPASVVYQVPSLTKLGEVMPKPLRVVSDPPVMSTEPTSRVCS